MSKTLKLSLFISTFSFSSYFFLSVYLTFLSIPFFPRLWFRPQLPFSSSIHPLPPSEIWTCSGLTAMQLKQQQWSHSQIRQKGGWLVTQACMEVLKGPLFFASRIWIGLGQWSWRVVWPGPTDPQRCGETETCRSCLSVGTQALQRDGDKTRHERKTDREMKTET